MDDKNKNQIPDYKLGWLPSYAPLALAYIPFQSSAQKRYEPEKALAAGTLFPGLDLPFMNMVNTPPDAPGPLRELMALDFVLDELELYLDTHRDDEEAFAVYQNYLALAAEARERYVSMCGVLQQTDQLGQDRYTWLSEPWPWDYNDRRK